MQLGGVDPNRRWKTAINILILAISLFVIAKTEKPIKEVSFVDDLLISTFGPMQGAISALKIEIDRYISDYFLNVMASRKNRQLQNQVGSLQETIFKLSEIEKENKRIRDLVEFLPEGQPIKVVARIVAWDASGDEKAIRINKGKKHGITLRAPVITAEGLVGFVTRLSENYSDILTILDPDNRVDAIVERTRSHGIVEGFSKNHCLMKYVTGREPIVLNDLVLTSGLGTLYPKGVKIGTVVHIERETYGITQTVELQPAVDFSKIEEVAVLITPIKTSVEKEWKDLAKKVNSEEGIRK